MMKNNLPAIETTELVYCYGDVPALLNVSLHIPSHSVYALVGPSGAGKSTLLSLLINSLHPGSGTAKVLGIPTEELSSVEYARMGYVTEDQKLPEWMSGWELLEFLEPLYPAWDIDLYRKLQTILKVPLSQKISQLSRGQRMKLRLLSAMAYHPELLLLDEPFAGLDPLTRDELASAILELTDEGDWTIVLSSHDVEEVERLADHAGFLADGRLHFSEPLDTLQNRFRSVEIQYETSVKKREIPPQWRQVEMLDNNIRFVDPVFDEKICRTQAETLGTIVHFDSQPLTLREIFISESKICSPHLRNLYV